MNENELEELIKWIKLGIAAACRIPDQYWEGRPLINTGQLRPSIDPTTSGPIKMTIASQAEYQQIDPDKTREATEAIRRHIENEIRKDIFGEDLANE